MDYFLTEQQQLIRDLARKVAEREKLDVRLFTPVEDLRREGGLFAASTPRGTSRWRERVIEVA